MKRPVLEPARWVSLALVEIDTTGGPGFGMEHYKPTTSSRTRKSS